MAVANDESKRRIVGMLGFAMRAGKLILGTELVCRAMPTGRVKLAVISSTASDGTVKKLRTKSEFYNIPSVTVDIGTEELGGLLGKTHPTAAVAVTDDGFAKEIMKATSVSQ